MNGLNKSIFAALVLATVVSAAVETQSEMYEVSEEKIAQEVDQELRSFGENPNLKNYKKTITTTPSPLMINKPNSSVITTSSIQSSTETITKKAAPVTSVAAEKVSKIKTNVVSKTNAANTMTSTKSSLKKSTSVTTTAPLAKSGLVSSGLKKSTSFQKLPVTFVEAAPLSNSRADEIRRQRQDEEMRTESKIVEKLEQSRMEDEKRRSEALFGDRNNIDTQQGAPQVMVQTIPEVIVPAAPVPEEAPLTLEDSRIESEIKTDISDFKSEDPGFFTAKYVGLTAGVPNYPDYKDVKGNYHVGLQFGMAHNRFMFEVGLSMAQYLLEDSLYGKGPNSGFISQSVINQLANSGFSQRADFEMRQFSGSLGSRYQILDGFVRPSVGGELTYSYRRYTSLEQTYLINSTNQRQILNDGTEYGNSHSVDFGLLAGVDLMINQQFSLGADLKYMFNVGYRLNGDNAPSDTTIENLQHLVGGLTGRFQF